MKVKKGLKIKFRNKIYRMTVSNTVSFLVLIAFALFAALPLIYVVSTSLKPFHVL